jgi:hydroxylaminobenzene mutase
MTDSVAGAAAFRASAGSGEAPRHALDPDQARSTKAAAVLALGVAAVVTGPLVGGIVPAMLALMLARQARGDLVAGRGYLTGSRQVRTGVILAWIGLGLAAAALVTASVIGIISLADNTGQHFPKTSD